MRFFTKIQDQIKNPDNKDFSVRKETMYPKNFDKDDPQYRRYPEERIARLLTVSQVCWSFVVFWRVSFRILLLTGQIKDES